MKTNKALHNPPFLNYSFVLKKPLFINLELAPTVKVHKDALSVMLRHVLSLVAACSVRRKHWSGRHRD